MQVAGPGHVGLARLEPTDGDALRRLFFRLSPKRFTDASTARSSGLSRLTPSACWTSTTTTARPWSQSSTVRSLALRATPGGGTPTRRTWRSSSLMTGSGRDWPLACSARWLTLRCPPGSGTHSQRPGGQPTGAPVVAPLPADGSADLLRRNVRDDASRPGAGIAMRAWVDSKGTKAERLRAIRDIGPYRGRQLQRLLPFFDEISLPAGSLIAREGDPCAMFVVVMRGRLTATQAGARTRVLTAGDTLAGTKCGSVNQTPPPSSLMRMLGFWSWATPSFAPSRQSPIRESGRS